MSQRVLVVDDDDMIRDVLRLTLQDEGYDVRVARDGREALEQLEGSPPALILLDLMMPRMDGAGFVRELERRGVRSAVSVVVLSAGASGERQATALRADGFVPKPFDLDLLLAVLADARAPGGDGAPGPARPQRRA
ncbi:MAG: response regulator [Chloroflexi bacterium]|nr:response regulator [Chloroflexota bacterium]